ncbi:hypothetical protein RhiirA4_485479 [Rhizophagus irregularis]|uniref:Uncharacterized protein n=1 Tax=Rhizophagus irregularis TaxID=588596 RepID=A0A2I1HQ71_9GLOM|nr:hypothetical protein RhiirA4_485479 [Rhizophagus irregularis]
MHHQQPTPSNSTVFQSPVEINSEIQYPYYTSNIHLNDLFSINMYNTYEIIIASSEGIENLDSINKDDEVEKANKEVNNFYENANKNDGNNIGYNENANDYFDIKNMSTKILIIIMKMTVQNVTFLMNIVST